MSGDHLGRRQMLSLVAGAAFTAGCTLAGGREEAACSGASSAESLHTGAHIPTYPYTETDTEPLSPSPCQSIDNPVLTAADTTDRDAVFVADPFLFVEGGSFHLFFEILDRGGYGVIGHATSIDGLDWQYDRVVLDPGYHLSFPYVFKWDGRYYMTPEDGRDPDDVVSLFRADSFPYRWRKVGTLLRPEYGENDHALFRWRDRWWLLVGDGPPGDVYLYHSGDLVSSAWIPHDDNPVVESRPTAARPAGRPIVREDHVLVFFQDSEREYGNKVRAYEMTELGPDRYADTELAASPILAGTGSMETVGILDRLSDEVEALDSHLAWNADRMHHIDPWYLGPEQGWLCAVDGSSGNRWSIGIYRA